MPKPTSDLTGQTFGRLTALSKAGVDSGRNVLWKCRCSCGGIITVRGVRLKAGATRSCGCLVGPAVSAANKARLTVHGMSSTPTGNSWMKMMQRCLNPNDPDYESWGGRGLVPCRAIRESPLNLVAAIGERPGTGYTLERPDGNRGYDCGACADCLSRGVPCNVRWATRKEQACNRRNTRLITAHGVTKPLSQWSEETGLPRSTIRNRLLRGWPPEAAVTS